MEIKNNKLNWVPPGHEIQYKKITTMKGKNEKKNTRGTKTK